MAIAKLVKENRRVTIIAAVQEEVEFRPRLLCMTVSRWIVKDSEGA